MSPPAVDPYTPDAPSGRATLLVADAIGELMGLWNFKPSMGRVWVVLYLSRQPLSADELANRAQLSTGSVSMTVKELLEWGVIKRDFSPGERRRRFAAETDILGMVTRVFRKRELVWIETLVARLEEAQRILGEAGPSSSPDDRIHNRFLMTRIEALLTLARAGRRVVERFARAGTLDLRGLRDALGRRGRAG